MTAYVRAFWTNGPKSGAYISRFIGSTTSERYSSTFSRDRRQEGFDAEWRMIDLMTVEGDLISRAELFDESDLDVALARFDELLDQLRGWRTRQAKWPNSFGCTSRPTTGTR